MKKKPKNFIQEDTHQKVYDELFALMVKKSLELDPQMVASTFVALGLRQYRTLLAEHDFERLLETFMETAKQIRPFTENPIDKGRLH